MLLAPVGGVLRRLDRDLAEAVLFQLMPGFCAHGLPSSLNGRMTIIQFNRRISGASKRVRIWSGMLSLARLPAGRRRYGRDASCLRGSGRKCGCRRDAGGTVEAHPAFGGRGGNGVAGGTPAVQ